MSDQQRTLRIATRASDLALWQAKFVADLLRSADDAWDVELVHISTEGDRDQKAPLHQMGGLGVFTREVQRAVLDGRADVAVHSLKDLPTESAPGLTLAGVPARASVFDALVLPEGQSSDSGWDDLPKHSRIGTGSLRRQAQLKHDRPDFEVSGVRGNVPTRIKKLDRGDYDALLLAVAGLERLNLAHRISAVLGPPAMYPAVGQGALGLECRSDDAGVIQRLQAITEPDVLAAVTAERALLAELEAGCHAPLGAYSFVENEELTLQAVVLDPEGATRLEAAETGPRKEPAALGKRLAAELLNRGAADLMLPRSQP